MSFMFVLIVETPAWESDFLCEIFHMLVDSVQQCLKQHFWSGLNSRPTKSLYIYIHLLRFLNYIVDKEETLKP